MGKKEAENLLLFIQGVLYTFSFDYYLDINFISFFTFYFILIFLKIEYCLNKNLKGIDYDT